VVARARHEGSFRAHHRVAGSQALKQGARVVAPFRRHQIGEAQAQQFVIGVAKPFGDRRVRAHDPAPLIQAQEQRSGAFEDVDDKGGRAMLGSTGADS
jgi:hypothetical protein